MSHENVLWVCEQKGDAKINLDNLNETLRSVCEELRFEPPEMFNIVKGKLIMHELEDFWGSCSFIYGFNEKFFLEELSKEIENNVEFLFGYDPEGNPPVMYKVRKEKVERISL
jgi:hypothetical protein